MLITFSVDNLCFYKYHFNHINISDHNIVQCRKRDIDTERMTLEMKID